MRIAVFHNLASGGAKRSLYEFVRGLAERGHHVDAYYLTSADEDFLPLSSVAAQTFSYEFVSPSPPASGFLGRLYWYLHPVREEIRLHRLQQISRTIADDIDCRSYHVAFVNHCQFVQSPYVLRYLSTPAVYFCHEPLRAVHEPPVTRGLRSRKESLTTRNTGLRGALRLPITLLEWKYRRKLASDDRINACSATLTITNSHYSREAVYKAYGLFAKVNYLGADTALFHPLPEQERENLVLSVGTLFPFKGHDYVIRALSHIPTHRRPKLVIAYNRASKEEKRFLVALASEHNVRLELYPMVTGRRLVGLYNRAQVTVCAQIMEPLGLVPLESMACGTPVVAVKEGGFRETVISGQTGFLVDRDPSKIAGAIDRLCSEPGLRTTLAQQGRAHVVDKWSWARSLDTLEKHLQSVAENV